MKVKSTFKCFIHIFSTVISLQGALKFNGGGHLNHSIFWQNLSPTSTKPSADLSALIDKSFGSFDKMKTDLSTATVAIQGSGWGWLGYDNKTGKNIYIVILKYFIYNLLF